MTGPSEASVVTAQNESKSDNVTVTQDTNLSKEEKSDVVIGKYVVYSGHGVGEVIDVEEQVVVGTKMVLQVIRFERDKMTLRIPMTKMPSPVMRELSTKNKIKKVYEVFSKKVRIKRAMWSKRAQEYEVKINSGDLLLVAEVIRDLYRREGVQEQSYSEKKLYDLAIERFSHEVSLVCNMTQDEVIQEIETILYNR